METICFSIDVFCVKEGIRTESLLFLYTVLDHVRKLLIPRPFILQGLLIGFFYSLVDLAAPFFDGI